MRNFLLFTLLIVSFSLSAQIPTFYGNVDGDWSNGMNWSGDTVPAAGLVIKLVGNGAPITIFGMQPSYPSKVIIPGGADITLTTDMVVNGTTSQAVQVWGNFTIGTGTTTINAGAGQFGMKADEMVTVNSGANLIVNGGSRNLQILGGKTVINNGTIMLNGATDVGFFIQTNGNFTNNGVIATDASPGAKGIQSHGMFMNSFTGEVRTIGPINNNNEIKVFGGTFTNNGFINAGNGKPLHINGGNFINNGLVKSFWLRIASQNGTCVNNGFYKYGNATMIFADEWGGGGIVDNGINLLDPMRTTIEAEMGDGSVIIANNSHNYSWSTQNSFQDGHSSSSTRGSGSLNTTDGNATLPANFFDDGATVDVISTTWPTHVILQVKQAVLPVELVSFNVTKKDHTVLIDWSTASEINSDFIAVERSQDGKSFSELGREQSRGNSNRLIDYSMVDNAPSNGMNYYRLKQVDRDGKLEYSNVKSVNILKEIKSWNIFPTMVSKNQSFSLDLAEFENKSVKVYVYDLVGNIIWYDTLTGGNTNNISLENVSNGIYLISIINGNTKSTKRITIF